MSAVLNDSHESPERVLDWIKRLRGRFLTRGGSGVQVAVANGATSTAITFANGMTDPDTRFGVVVTPSWDTTAYITARTATGFTVSYGTAAGATDTIDYLVFRS